MNLSKNYVEGRAITHEPLWRGHKIEEGQWISTGRHHLFVVQYGIKPLIRFYLEQYPETDSIHIVDEDGNYALTRVDEARFDTFTNQILETLNVDPET
jgi:hypothetical protein